MLRTTFFFAPNKKLTLPWIEFFFDPVLQLIFMYIIQIGFKAISIFSLLLQHFTLMSICGHDIPTSPFYEYEVFQQLLQTGTKRINPEKIELVNFTFFCIYDINSNKNYQKSVQIHLLLQKFNTSHVDSALSAKM